MSDDHAQALAALSTDDLERVINETEAGRDALLDELSDLKNNMNRLEQEMKSIEKGIDDVECALESEDNDLALLKEEMATRQIQMASEQAIESRWNIIENAKKKHKRAAQKQ